MKAVIDMGNLRRNGQRELKELLSVIVDVIRKEKNFNFNYVGRPTKTTADAPANTTTREDISWSNYFISCDIFRFHYD